MLLKGANGVTVFVDFRLHDLHAMVMSWHKNASYITFWYGNIPFNGFPSHMTNDAEIQFFVVVAKVNRLLNKQLSFGSFRSPPWRSCDVTGMSRIELSEPISLGWLISTIYSFQCICFVSYNQGAFQNRSAISTMHKNRLFQCMDNIFCAEFQRYKLKFHTKYLTHTLEDV